MIDINQMDHPILSPAVDFILINYLRGLSLPLTWLFLLLFHLHPGSIHIAYCIGLLRGRYGLPPGYSYCTGLLCGYLLMHIIERSFLTFQNSCDLDPLPNIHNNKCVCVLCVCVFVCLCVYLLCAKTVVVVDCITRDSSIGYLSL